MPYTPFMPEFDQLPETLPVFPLPDAVVMPGAELPLNVYEPRYLAMVADAMGSHHMFGMVQPDPTREEEPEAVFRTGCGGRITRYQEITDGRKTIRIPTFGRPVRCSRVNDHNWAFRQLFLRPVFFMFE